MNRHSIRSLSLAAVCGAVATCLVSSVLDTHFARGPQAVRPTAGREPRLPARRVPALDEQRPPGVEDVLAIYEIAAAAGRRELDGLLRDAASRTRSPAQRLLLHALLTRYGELDIGEALRALRELDVEHGLLVSLYTQWVHVDADAVLAALRDIEDRSEARIAALALIRFADGGDELSRRVLAALPEADRLAVQADAVVASASTQPAAALGDALAFDRENVRFRLVQQIGAIWAESDPKAAIAASASILDRTLKSAYETNVLTAWAGNDLESLLRYAATLDPASQGRLILIHAFDDAFDSVDPALLIELAERLGHRSAEHVRRAAIRHLALDDPREAIAVAESLATSNAQRQGLFLAIAPAYARKHADEAFDWARRTGHGSVIDAVLGGVAQVDPDRALDFALSMDAELGPFSFYSIFRFGAENGASMPSLGQRVLGLYDETVRRRALQDLGSAWVSVRPSAAMAWLTSQADRIHPDVFADVAYSAANQDLGLAIAYAERVPDAAIARWTTALVSSYANADPEGALRWVVKQRGQPGFEDAVLALVDHAATFDLAAATALVAELESSDHARRAVANLAYHWMAESPEAAGNWIAALQDEDLMGAAAAAVALEWARRDAAAARGWALGLPFGKVRDEALKGLWTTQFLRGTFDHELLEAFSSSEFREGAILEGLRYAAPRDSAAARELVAKYITDPAALAEAERLIAKEL